MFRKIRKQDLFTGAGALVLLAVGLAWVSGDASVRGALSFAGGLALGGGFLFGGLCALSKGERLPRQSRLPRWLVWLTVGAALLRLGAGVLWFTALPTAGYDTEVQKAGYVMEDAFRRDRAAWSLAQSEKPLTKAFTGYRSADQYGGLLFASAAVYRLLGGTIHAPLLIVVLTASISALTVPFAWAFTRRVFDERPAKWVAWGLALYPEAVLLGSSQMREAFVMPLVAAAFYGLARYRQTRARQGLVWTLGALALLVPLSPPFAGILALLLGIVGLALDDWRIIRNWRLWAALGGLALVAGAAVWLGWDQIAPRLTEREFSSPVEMVSYWFELSARWQAKQTTEASGWVQKIVRSTPEAFNLPFFLSYGAARPLLPSALTAWSAPVWRFIGIGRALGWTLLLPLLLYAPLRALRFPDRRNLALGLSLAVWAGVLIAAFWGGADQWDNPRYRVAFVGLQMPLAAWALAEQLRKPDPWMKRALVFVLSIFIWFVPWYLRRYTRFDQIFGWTVVDVFKVLGLGLATGGLYIIWDWAAYERSIIEEQR